MKRSKARVTADEAVQCIDSGSKVFVHSNAAVPQMLVQAMARRHEELRDVQIYHILTLGELEKTAPYCMKGMEKSFTAHAFFTSRNTRDAVNEGRAYYYPIFLHQVPRLIRQTGIDVALLQLSPPDPNGYCSMGVSVDVARSAIECARTIIAEINPNMPRTLGQSYVHIGRIDYTVDVDYQLPTYGSKNISRTVKLIGKNVASLIDDGCVLQMGIGAIPDAVLSLLHDRKHLGIHTEMFSDGIIDLVEKGVIDNSTKKVIPEKILSSFIIGSRELYEWVHDNPLVEMRPSDFTNDPVLIAKNNKVVAINSAIEIDLKGQVCSDSLGIRIYSGIGGQVDFIRGATMSEGGKPVIAMESMVRDKETGEPKNSKIVSRLHSGAGVVTGEGDIHYVVTEYGIAALWGKGVGERATELINIAHPQFRRGLVKKCREFNYLIDEHKIRYDQEEVALH